MQPRKLSASELVEAVRSNTSYSAMMSKYSLSEKQLDAVFTKLVEKGVIRAEELPRRSGLSSRGLTGRTPQLRDQSGAEIAHDAVQFWPLLRGEWDKVSVDFVKKLMVLIKEDNWPVIERALVMQAGFEERMIRAVGKEGFCWNLLIKAEAFWTLQVEASDRWNTARIWGEQIKTFSQKHPERWLHPEIARQLRNLTETGTPSILQIDCIAQRLQRLTDREDRFTGLSDVQVARTWHADSIKYADENGIGTGRITGSMDKLTCPVCSHLVGTAVDIAAMLEKIDSDLDIKDPGAYEKAWPFPRIEDLDGVDRAKLGDLLIKKGWLPPFHPDGCRHSIAWLYLKEAGGQKGAKTAASKKRRGRRGGSAG